MLLPLLLSLAAADAEPPAPPARTKILVLDATGDLGSSGLATLTELVVVRLSRFDKLEVSARRNVEKLLGVEAQKQLAGCEGGSDCLADLAGAFDADLVATTQAGKLGGTTVFTLQLVDSQGVTVGRGTAQVSALDDLAAQVSGAIDDVGRELTGAEPGNASASASSAVSSSDAPAALQLPLLVGGGVGVGVGVAVALLAMIPALNANGAESDLKVLRTRYIQAGRDDDILGQAAARQAEADQARGQWNNVGIYAFWGGFVVAAGGGAALAAAFFVPDAP